MRTTSALEAYNHVLGDKIMRKSNLFRFVLSIKQEEYLKTSEFLLYLESAGGTGNKQKRVYRVNNYLN